jgi:hypothetical protein
MQPSMRVPTIVLAVGAVVLLAAVAIGERMGNRVIGQATEQQLQSVVPAAVSPSPNSSPKAYGPDWKRSQSLSAAGDPRFPDPRVPPKPLPTLPPTPKPRPTPVPTPTPNPDIPIWRQKPLPTFTPSEAPSGEPAAIPTENGEGAPGSTATPPPGPRLRSY